jgi:hypothetical protein
MPAMRESWTDERLDDLNGRVGEGFSRLDARIDRVGGEVHAFRAEVNGRFEVVHHDINELRAEMNSRFDSMQRTMVQGTIALSASMLAGFAALLGLVATQI